jgi:energy-coupling factor transporter ATP-binding protein EcfA2
LSDGHLTIDRFAAFEDLEAAFRLHADMAVPRQHGGLRLFWEDFRELHANAFRRDPAGRLSAWITANPRDCLAYGTAEQVLRAAVLAGGAAPGRVGRAVERIAARFELSGLRRQPLRTLSGGEAVRLALAKVAGLSPRLGSLTVASPFSWLSEEGRRHFDRLVGDLLPRGVPVELLAMEGEDSREPAPPEPAWTGGRAFRLSAEGVRFPLATPLEAMFGASGRAALEDTDVSLRSPCQLTGGNGQGKSLVARLLAGAVGHSGRIAVGPAQAPPSRARLLFQDVLNQTLMRPPERLAARGHREGALSCYRRMRGLLPEGVRDQALPDPLEGAGAGHRSLPSLFTVKMLLAASRLHARPGALILDEPDWGLTRQSALGLVSAVSAAAGEAGVPVLLISHKPWWLPRVASRLRVEKRSRPSEGPGDPPVRLAFRLVEEG